METESVIAKWYSGKSVFITGATGFMGKVLVEKLFRSCPDVGPVYVLVRNKNNMPPRDRIDEILKSSAFDEVRSATKDRKDWLIPILGDVGLPDLGISSEDRRLLQRTVSVVFHLAATVKFNEPLKTAVAVNLDGTKTLMELCLGMTNVCAIVHVSTAYSNCILQVIEERVYPPPADLNIIENCVAGLNDDLLELVTPRLVGNHPNTYTFTKALAENVVSGYSTKLPIAIVRPSGVTASWREPIPGWVDNAYGPTGIVVGASNGLVKSIYGPSMQLVTDLIPVDICANLIIAAAWEIGTRGGAELVQNVRVYNCVSRPFNPLLMNDFIRTMNKCMKKYPVSKAFWIPKLTMTDSRIKHTLTDVLEQTLPATLADICIWFSGGTPKLRRYSSKWAKFATALEFFIIREFDFNADNVKELKGRLNAADRVIFDFDVSKMSWEEYLLNYFFGIRRHVMNEKDDAIPASRRSLSMKKALRIGILSIIVIICLKIFHSFSTA